VRGGGLLESSESSEEAVRMIPVKASIQIDFSEALRPWLELRDAIRAVGGGQVPKSRARRWWFLRRTSASA